MAHFATAFASWPKQGSKWLRVFVLSSSYLVRRTGKCTWLQHIRSHQVHRSPLTRHRVTPHTSRKCVSYQFSPSGCPSSPAWRSLASSTFSRPSCSSCSSCSSSSSSSSSCSRFACAWLVVAGCYWWRLRRVSIQFHRSIISDASVVSRVAFAYAHRSA